uniref:Pacifastin domain-containing protein n=1 Tax=Chromera velia CCMP2878 TaxID=1169474 RepID=A0A0G4FBX2_9ALVE|mmetsp:Transcript_27762/g.54452  ORF Transcript_27762/g.54452 Transcript_27762/m.54452 type:complete len:180 (-) Transcript_27762:443-982(-)|eukprot:Cvel_16093.t1-p1 / transcript=Cvel_16093.t1 / gene=Cvel_16093 / organism=Chromera_velia_CCMP2878 / gene_product=hypothetical protein / transcript_product=hypothetical protein / location=Cvel_scaffold1224:37028-39313(+) / protein_length=179 / sequence_SO=supercontig / SO=protein_coding / is_pseudo=false
MSGKRVVDGFPLVSACVMLVLLSVVGQDIMQGNSCSEAATQLGLPADCTSWNDGCNTCHCSEGYSPLCTMRFCIRQGEPSCSAYASEGLGGQAEGTLTSIEEAENSQVVSGVPQETTEEQQDGSVAAPRPALSPAESTKETAEKQSEPLRERGPMYCYTRERWSPQKRQFCCRTYGLGC